MISAAQRRQARNMSAKRVWVALLGAVFAISLAGIRASHADTTVSAHLLHKDDLEAFFDGLIPLQLERSDVAGASVLVMKDGETLLLKGYGYSDLKSKHPVDPTSTIFRLASISKLFTWISAMQLVEQGKLNLDVDIGRYLDFPIKTNSGISAPITLRNLMTHTGGFEDTTRNLALTDNKYYQGLREFLIENQPHRLFQPGKVPAYSNYGVGLGSYIVQRVSGEPFEQYVAEHIFSPLGMTHSTFIQPPPAGPGKTPFSGLSLEHSQRSVWLRTLQSRGRRRPLLLRHRHGAIRLGVAQRRRTRRSSHPEAGFAAGDVDPAISSQR